MAATLKMDPIAPSHMRRMRTRNQDSSLPLPPAPAPAPAGLPSANNKVAIIVAAAVVPPDPPSFGRRNAAIIGHEIFPTLPSYLTVGQAISDEVGLKICQVD